VVAVSVAIPLLAGLLVLNRQEVFRGRATGSVVVETARVVAQLSAGAGSVNRRRRATVAVLLTLAVAGAARRPRP
jgi:hypothetical protein